MLTFRTSTNGQEQRVPVDAKEAKAVSGAVSFGGTEATPEHQLREQDGTHVRTVALQSLMPPTPNLATCTLRIV